MSTKRANPPISHDLFAGTMGGCLGLLVSHPMDLVKVRMQVGGPAAYNSIIETLRCTHANEGVAGFYKGIAPPLVTAGAINAVVFTVYGGTQRFLERDLTDNERKHGKIGRLAASAAIAGLATCLIATPVELIKCQQQVNTTSSVGTWDMARSIIRRHGISGLYRGWSVTVGRDVPAFTLYFLSYEAVKDALTAKPPPPPPPPARFEKAVSSTRPGTVAAAGAITATAEPEDDSFAIMAAGAVAGLAAWVFVYPIDTVKTMVQTDTSRKGMASWPRVMLDMHTRQGWNGPLWRGFGAMLCRTMPMNAVTFLVYERTISYLQKGSSTS